jgi:hypothetical protein
MKEPAIVFRCDTGCPARREGDPPHSRVCLESMLRRMKKRLREEQLRKCEARAALDQISQRRRTERAGLVGIIYGLRNSQAGAEASADELLLYEKRTGGL